jgi:transcriptional regulator with XRE-family HTH domain
MTGDDIRRAELRQFLQSRRARLRPEDVGLPSGGRRRVPGLRREEVAALAGVGVTWYTMFETGTASGVSIDVVEAVARALRFSAAERHYLVLLATEAARTAEGVTPDPLALRALTYWIDAPAYIITTCWDVIAWNEAYRLVWAVEPPGSAPFNAVIRTFVDPVARAMHGEHWHEFASRLVAMLRTGYARFSGDPRYEAMLETLRDDSDFAELWERLDVAQPGVSTPGIIESPGVGHFRYDVLNLGLSNSSDQFLMIQVPDESSAARLRDALLRRPR